jgi:hypothetical protein
VVGCPRSGTTLLRRMLDAHPEIAITPETHWITQWFEKQGGVDSKGEVTREFVADLLRSARFKKMNISDERVWELFRNGKSVSYARLVRRVFDTYGSRRGKPFVGDKTPGYATAIPILHHLFPSARFVHLIRDGRDVCLSANSWYRVEKLKRRFACWRENPVASAALWWEMHVRHGREAGTRLEPGLYFELRYEKLVANPFQESSALCDFLGLRYSDSMLRFHEGRTRRDPTLESKKQWLPVTPGLRDWRSQMADHDAELFEATAGALLDELGYVRAFPTIPGEVDAQVARVRGGFTQDLRARGLRPPDMWAT